jgi:hypothetical protein
LAFKVPKKSFEGKLEKAMEQIKLEVNDSTQRAKLQD